MQLSPPSIGVYFIRLCRHQDIQSLLFIYLARSWVKERNKIVPTLV